MVGLLPVETASHKQKSLTTFFTAVELMERNMIRWSGEAAEGDYTRDPLQQILENAAASIGIDPSDQDNPILKD